jgi:hypothetical protein
MDGSFSSASLESPLAQSKKARRFPRQLKSVIGITLSISKREKPSAISSTPNGKRLEGSVASPFVVMTEMIRVRRQESSKKISRVARSLPRAQWSLSKPPPATGSTRNKGLTSISGYTQVNNVTYGYTYDTEAANRLV